MSQIQKRLCWWCTTHLMKLGARTLSTGQKVHAKCEPYAARYIRHAEVRPYSAIPPGTTWGRETND